MDSMDAKEKQIDQASASFKKLEEDFQHILSSLSNDENLKVFKREYEKLYSLLVKSHAKEKSLLKKINELNSQILRNAKKVKRALELSEIDQETIVQLRSEIEKEWKIVEIAHEKEKITKKTIEDLSNEISKLSQRMNVEQQKDENSDLNVEKLTKMKEKIIFENNTLKNSLLVLVDRVDEVKDSIKKMSVENEKIKKEIRMVEKDNHKRLQEYNEVLEEKSEYDKRINEKTTEAEKLRVGNEDLAQKLEESKEILADLKKKKKAKMISTSELKKKFEQKKEALSYLERENKVLIKQTSELESKKEKIAEETQKCEMEISQRNKTIEKTRVQFQRSKNKCENSLKELKKLEGSKGKLLDQLDKINSKTITSLKNDLNVLRKESNRLKYSNNLLNGNLRGVERTAKEFSQQIVMCKSNKLNVEKIFGKFKRDAEKYKFLIFDIERSKTKLNDQTQETLHKYHRERERFEVLERKNEELKKNLKDNLLKLKRQNELYEKVRKERNFYSKNYINSNDNIKNMKAKFAILLNKIKQLKTEIQLSEQVQFENLEKLKGIGDEKKKLKLEKEKIHEEIKVKKKSLFGLREKIKEYGMFLIDQDKEKKIQEKERKAVFKDRDILGNQLIKRDKEINLIYEKIEIQKRFLQRGAECYEERTKEIAVLKDKLKELIDRMRSVRNLDDFFSNLEKKIFKHKNQFTIENNNLNMLKQELKIKMNVHRWRYLEGIDPEKYEMILKLNTLQKKLIKKCSVIRKKEEVLIKKVEETKKMKNVLARQPGPEIFHQIKMFKQIIDEKKMQCEEMQEEFDMKKCDIDKLNREIRRMFAESQDLKKKFYNAKNVEIKKNYKPFVPKPMYGMKMIRTGGGFTLTL